MELDIALSTVLLFGAMLVLLATGLPIVFVLGGIAMLLTVFLFGGFGAGTSLFYSTWAWFIDQMILAIPLFLLMAGVLQYSGIADSAYDMFYKLMGGLRGGLSIGTVIICTIFAAITGTSGAATVSMGVIAIPSMIKRGYDKRLATGSVMAGGVLGILIPPSILMIIYGLLARESVGKLFIGGIFPGLLAATLYSLYIGIRCWRSPEMGPSLAVEERATWSEKVRSFRALVLPLLLILTVLGSIYLGVATPTEAAAIGAFGAFICAAIKRRLNLTMLKQICLQTLRLCGMIYWILGAAVAFSHVYTQMGARAWIYSTITGLELNRWVILIIMELSFLVLGCMMDDGAIIMLTAPIYVPIVKALGFDGVWFGVLFIMNMNIGYLTPPFGYNLFYMKGLTPFIKEQTGVEITLVDIYRGVVPFILLMLVSMIIVMFFPMLVTWLPSTMF